MFWAIGDCIYVTYCMHIMLFVKEKSNFHFRVLNKCILGTINVLNTHLSLYEFSVDPLSCV